MPHATMTVHPTGDNVHAVVAISAVAISALARFGAGIPLGLTAANVHSRLRPSAGRSPGAPRAFDDGIGGPVMPRQAGPVPGVLARPGATFRPYAVRARLDLVFVPRAPSRALQGVPVAGQPPPHQRTGSAGR
jgi:hypothetical protein